MSKNNLRTSKTGLREIASAAGVSISTASRVLNGSSRVDPSLQKSVLDVVAKLNIDLSQRDKAKSLAFLVGNRGMNDAFHSRILLGAEASCVAHGWDILFLCFNYSPNTPWKELPLPKVVQRHDMVRGVLLTGTNFGNLIELLYNKGITSVALGNNLIGDPKLLNTDAVFSDDIQGSTDATRYLISLGHRDIWFLGNNHLPWFARCYSGYCRAMEEAGLAPRQCSIDSEDSEEIGYLGIKSLLARGERVTAVFAGNDPTAHGVYKGLRDSGMSIPDDVSVVGCNDTFGGMLYPALTTVREFPEQLGKQMVELLLNRIAKPSLAPQAVTVPTQFIKRDSCRPISTPIESPAKEIPLESCL
ncbi:LacI family DNA-binding transcriptional regulator [Edaphobacter bradus]|uniref:LacI family DNA-binding transcriptional regulator n=1 Tax=Edaphobacter bradus TaxID=2259016 RepID=UPI0021E0F708|nr:LacI family DNA-binding transcriptional regulator [Edaphobacter bradus]